MENLRQFPILDAMELLREVFLLGPDNFASLNVPQFAIVEDAIGTIGSRSKDPS